MFIIPIFSYFLVNIIIALKEYPLVPHVLRPKKRVKMVIRAIFGKYLVGRLNLSTIYLIKYLAFSGEKHFINWYQVFQTFFGEGP